MILTAVGNENASAMVGYSSLSRQPPPDDNGIELSTHQFEDCYILTPADSNPHGEASLQQDNDDKRASYTGWDSLAEFIDKSFRPSIDLSTLAAPGLLDHRPYQSDGMSIRSMNFHSEAPDGHRRMTSVNPSLSSERSYKTHDGWTQAFPASKYAPANASGGKMWNPIWLTKTVLTSFFVLFVGIFIVVLALDLYSEAHSGLR